MNQCTWIGLFHDQPPYSSIRAFKPCSAIPFEAINGGESLIVVIAIPAGLTVAVNTLVVMEVFYLFSVRFFSVRFPRAHSLTLPLTLRGVLGTRPVLIAVAAVTTLRLVFTCAPFMGTLFATRPLGGAEGVPVLTAGVLLFAALEMEKLVLRRPGAGAK